MICFLKKGCSSQKWEKHYTVILGLSEAHSNLKNDAKKRLEAFYLQSIGHSLKTTQAPMVVEHENQTFHFSQLVVTCN